MNVEKYIADGVIDQEELDEIRKECLGDDGRIDRDEANQLFQINDAVSGNDNCPGWEHFMVYAITIHVTEDVDSPGVVDDDEAAWLIEKIGADGKYDDVEKAIVYKLCSNFTVPDSIKNLQN